MAFSQIMSKTVIIQLSPPSSLLRTAQTCYSAITLSRTLLRAAQIGKSAIMSTGELSEVVRMMSLPLFYIGNSM